MPFDVDAFRRQFHDCCNQAEGIRAPEDVRARVVREGGREFLRGACPRCGQKANLSGEGKHLCRKCGAWLRYRREG